VLDIDYTDIKKLQTYWYDKIKARIEKSKKDEEQQIKETERKKREEEEEQARVVEATRKMKEERERKQKQLEEENKELQRLEKEKKTAEEQEKRDLEKVEKNLKKTREAVNKQQEQERQEGLKKTDYYNKTKQCIDKAILTMTDNQKNKTLQQIIDNWNNIIACIKENTPSLLKELKISEITIVKFDNITENKWIIPEEYLNDRRTTSDVYDFIIKNFKEIQSSFEGKLKYDIVYTNSINTTKIDDLMKKFNKRKELWYKLNENHESWNVLLECLRHVYDVLELSGHSSNSDYKKLLKELYKAEIFKNVVNNVLYMLKHGNIQSEIMYESITADKNRGFLFFFLF
jgi:chemotaxis protein histidine kinase CheA